MATMAANTYWYANAFANALGGSDGLQSINFITDTINAALLKDTYTPNQSTDVNWSTINSHEITGEGYTAGGQTLANKTLTIDGNNIVLDSNNPSWYPASITARWLVLYCTTSGLLLGYMDLGQNIMSINGPFEIQWNEDGMLLGTAQAPE
jgi:tryptophan 2,3-dioxygenase